MAVAEGDRTPRRCGRDVRGAGSGAWIRLRDRRDGRSNARIARPGRRRSRLERVDRAPRALGTAARARGSGAAGVTGDDSKRSIALRDALGQGRDARTTRA
ncbi:hypothetical protein DB32_004472 [Sandaracinus amylolyticus]|uniref:Uncharacterized protein n=1 Tax=Sandaracinus amylolyticus TaxID=927083 RepID=A0A0F6W4P5_9BACT|nr:hypothetical protein DB32_004472 [Sandaracinus amylolyticus]